MKQTEFFGFNSICNLKKVLGKESIKNVFLVTGKNSYTISGAETKIKQNLDIIDSRYTRFSDFTPNPQLKEILGGYLLFQQGNYDAIIAVGGGSPMDVAKSIKLFNFEEYNKTLPLIVIPTTAGSGSEATSFIVYYIGKEKQSKGNPDITLPDYVICDPKFTMSLPKHIAASTGIDALSQAIESYWSINSTLESKDFASQSIKILIDNLENAVNNPTKQTKEKVMIAANLAGKAINIAKTTSCHSIAYPLTSYFNIPHGHAVGLNLGEMFVYNSNVSKKNCLDKRGKEYVRKTMSELNFLLNSQTPKQSKEKINNLMKNIGLETRLSRLNIKKEGLKTILEKGFNPARVKNNPRLLIKRELKKLLEKIYL